jgi:hypothetical protein
VIRVLALLLWLAPALAAAAPPAAERQLLAAARDGDRTRLARAAERLGPARLATLLASASPETQRAALLAAPEIDEGWTLLPLVAERLATPEGARAAARIAHRLRDASSREGLEIDADVLETARRRCAEAAAIAELPAAARADLLACAVDLGEPAAVSFLFDPQPEVRDAAISLLAASTDDAWRDAALDAARAADSATAAPALAALCTHDPRRTARELDAATRARIPKLAAADPSLRTALGLCRRRR